MDRVVGGKLYPLDSILDHQFAALQLANAGRLRRVNERFMQFVLEYFVLTLQLNEMGLTQPL